MQNRKDRFPQIRLAILVAGLLLAANGPIMAASACKGLSQSKCDANSACSWVSSYQAKSGVKVDAYCRSKSSKSKGAGEAMKSDKAKQMEGASSSKQEKASRG